MRYDAVTAQADSEEWATFHALTYESPFADYQPGPPLDMAHSIWSIQVAEFTRTGDYGALEAGLEVVTLDNPPLAFNDPELNPEPLKVVGDMGISFGYAMFFTLLIIALIVVVHVVFP